MVGQKSVKKLDKILPIFGVWTKRMKQVARKRRSSEVECLVEDTASQASANDFTIIARKDSEEKKRRQEEQKVKSRERER